MTAEQIDLFARRLLLDDVTATELAALPVQDLLALILQLVHAGREVEGSLYTVAGPISYGSAVISVGPKQTSSARHPLAE